MSALDFQTWVNGAVSLASPLPVVAAAPNSGWRMTPWNAFRHPVLLIRLVFTPLLFRSLKTSEELGIAAELKGLGYGEGMRPYRKLVWKASDTWLLVAACLVAVAAVLCQHAVGWAPLEGGMR